MLCCVQEPGLGLSTKKEQADLLQEVQCFLTVYTVLYTVVFIQCVYAVIHTVRTIHTILTACSAVGSECK